MELYLKALRVAAHAHRNQVRKFPGPDGLLAPYIEHPVRVASRVLMHAGESGVLGFETEVLAAAALLHDVVEETGLGQLYVNEMFGIKIGGLVDLVTRKKGQGVGDYYKGFVDGDPSLGGPIPGCFLRNAARLLKLADIHENLLDAFLAPPDFRRHSAAKYRGFLMAVTHGTGNPFDTSVPLDLWNSVVRLLERLEGSTDPTP